MTAAVDLKKLDYFVGTWLAEGLIHEGPLGPGGAFTATNRMQWMDGGFFLVVQSRFSGAMGTGTETAYMGYDASASMYTYDSFNSLGEVSRARGTLEGDTWTWLSETLVGQQAMKGRLTNRILSPSSYAFTFETSPDGKNWSMVLEGRNTRVT